jgi:MarR family transcriptional regulator, organic hydroperoxide resistance regulator
MPQPTTAPTRLQLDPTLDFLRLLWGVETCLQSTSKRMASSIGITGPQRFTLRIVSRFPGISPTDVADLLRLHPSTITGVLQRLVDKGLLARQRDASDARRMRLHLRPGAARFTRVNAGTVEAAVGRALRRLPRATVAKARDVLAALIDELEGENRRAARRRA